MSWNYRVVRRVFPGPGYPDETQFAIYEAYYARGIPPDGQPDMLTVEPVTVSGESTEAVADVLAKMLRATTMPVVEWDSINGAGPPERPK